MKTSTIHYLFIHHGEGFYAEHTGDGLSLESSLTLARTVNKCHLEDRHTLMETENTLSAYVNVKIIKYTKEIALTYISCVFHRNAAFVGA